MSNKCTEWITRSTTTLQVLNESFNWQPVWKERKCRNHLPSEWHHLTQHMKTRKSWSGGALHILAGPSSSAVQMEELQGLGLGCCCFLLSVFLGPLVDEKGRAQRPGQPLPQASLGPPDKSLWPWNLHNAMQVRLVPRCQWFFTHSGQPTLFICLGIRACVRAYGRKI